MPLLSHSQTAIHFVMCTLATQPIGQMTHLKSFVFCFLCTSKIKFSWLQHDTCIVSSVKSFSKLRMRVVMAGRQEDSCLTFLNELGSTENKNITLALLSLSPSSHLNRRWLLPINLKPKRQSAVICRGHECWFIPGFRAAATSVALQQFVRQRWSRLFDSLTGALEAAMLYQRHDVVESFVYMHTLSSCSYYGRPYLHCEPKKGCHPNHGYNFVNSWSICKILSLLQRAVNFQQNPY